jgi:hypothetical protein
MTNVLEERNAATRTSAAVVAVLDLDAAALYEHRKEVALAAYDLGYLQTEVDVGGQGDGDVARRQGGQRGLVILYEKLKRRKTN